MYGQVNWKHSFLRDSNDYRESWLDAVLRSKATPLLILRRSVPVCADHAALVILFNKGFIRRIFVSMDVGPAESNEVSISRLKASFPGQNAIFSVVSSKRGQRLIYVWSFNETAAPPAA